MNRLAEVACVMMAEHLSVLDMRSYLLVIRMQGKRGSLGKLERVGSRKRVTAWLQEGEE